MIRVSSSAISGALKCAASLLALLFVCGCQFPGPRTFNARAPLTAGVSETVAFTNQVTPDLLQGSATLFTLGPGDVIEVEIVGDMASHSILVVGPDGKIYFNLLPGLDVWGLTLEQARALLEGELGKYMREKPQVGITLRAVESKKIWLLGRFLAPGVYPLTNSMSLLEAVYMAGGPATLSSTPEFTRDYATYNSDDNLADLGHSFVLRNGQLIPVDFLRLLRGDLSQNIQLHPDDFVYLPPAASQRIYVIGAVGVPQREPYVRNMTLAMAIANAGGTLRDSYERQVAIVRGSLTRPEIALIDYNEIVRGRAADVVLQSGDIVYVPYEPYRILKKYFDVIATTFVSSVAINEGARAALRSPAPTSGILIPFGSTITITPSTPAR